MKSEMRALLLGVVCLCPAAAFAQALPVVQINNQFWASFDVQHTDYSEHLTPGDSEHGWTPGFGVGASAMGTLFDVSNVFGSVSYHHQTGSLTYDGSDFYTGAPLIGSSGLTTDDVVAELGRGFLLSPVLLVTPVFQAGYHGWNRNLGDSETEDYRHVLLGAAIRVDYAATPRLVATLRGGIAGMVGPKIDIHFVTDSSQGLGGSAIFQGMAKLDYALTSRLHLFTAADVQHFDYGRSRGTPFGVNEILYEPASTTTNVTLSTGIAYAF